MIYFTQKH